MVRPDSPAVAPRSVAGVADAADLRSMIATALAADPINEDALRRGVWTFVRAERDAGAQPGQVIIALTALVDAASLGPPLVRQARLRQVILTCVEAYFGHLGGNAVSGDSKATIAPRRASNR
jgi:hypothetical protein